MSLSWVAVLLLFYAGAATARGYACSQPALYRQCQCPSFCGSYNSAPGGYIIMYDSGYGGYGGGLGGGYGDLLPRRHKKRRHHKKKKFRFETAEEPEEELPEHPSEPEERRPSPSEPEEKSSNSKHSWENEDKWEKKFVSHKSKSKEPEGGSEELPEIDDEDITSAKGPAAAKDRADKLLIPIVAQAREENLAVKVQSVWITRGAADLQLVDLQGNGGPLASLQIMQIHPSLFSWSSDTTSSYHI
ncbi:unnamed protein product [Cylicocyclus nassatus]|uniref:Uncharacterized protein n=1 Tax=Cylicocyclus nassatus TaxID=53992 RepID=A0AA36HCH0_CYLNA|nr:unnamed protein product [Cylicocyclus nassatus]